ncbi:MAG: WD40/YVTN/BNR-like repeat-containing protein, partial [Methylobacter sp.]
MERRGKVASYHSKHRYGDCEVGMNRVMTVLEHRTTKYNARVLICICLLLAGGFAGTAKAGINKWTAIGPEGGGSINTLAIDPSDPMTLYAGSGDNGSIFMSTRGGGVFKSTDSGASWQVVNSGLPPNLGVNVLAIDPLDGATLYAGTNGHSVFIITFKTLGDIDQDGDIDRSDLARITAALNQPANGPDDLRDLNGDLSIA